MTVKSEVVDYLRKVATDVEELKRHETYELFEEHACFILSDYNCHEYQYCPIASKILNCNTSKVCIYKPNTEMFLIRQQLVKIKEFYSTFTRLKIGRISVLAGVLERASHNALDEYKEIEELLIEFTLALKENKDFSGQTKEYRQRLSATIEQILKFRDDGLAKIEQAKRWYHQMESLVCKYRCGRTELVVAELNLGHIENDYNLGILFNLQLDRVKRLLAQAA